MPLTAAIKIRRFRPHPLGRLVGLVRRLNRQFWTHLLPFALIVLLCSWLALQAAGAIDRNKTPAKGIAASIPD